MADSGNGRRGGVTEGGRANPAAGLPADPDDALAALAATVQELRTLTEHITDVVTRTGLDHTIEWVSSSVTTTLGWRPDEVLGHPYDEFWHEADLPVLLAATRQAVGGQAVRFRARARAKDGSYRWMEVTGRAVLDEDGRPLHAITVGRDVEDQVRAEQALAAAAQEFGVIAESISDVIIRTRPDLTIEYVSPSMRDVGGWEPDELVGRSNLDLFHPEDLASLAATRAAGLDGDEIRFRGRALRKDGSYRWVEVVGRVVRGEDGEPLYGVSIARDIEERMRTERALADSEERFRLLAESTSDVITRTSTDGVIEYASPSLEAVLGWDPQDWTGTSYRDWWHPEDQPGAAARRAEAAAGRPARFRGRVRRRDGTYRWIEVDGRAIRDSTGTVTGQATVMRDIEDEVRAVEELAYQATHDRLTGLLNREQLTDRLQRSLIHRPRTGTRLAILFCDIDNLKTVNDTHGHAVGDAVIVAVADAIAHSVRASDTVARVGGDEFVAVLVGVRDVSDAGRLAHDVHATASRSVAVGDIVVRPTLSIGVTVARSGQSVDDVLREADAAMYEAKRAGRDRVVLADAPRAVRP